MNAPGLFRRLTRAFSRRGASLGRELRELFVARRIDDSLLEELEERLLLADVGVEATSEVLAEVRRRVARHEVSDADSLLDAVRERLTAILAPCQRPLVIDPAAHPYVILVVGVNGAGKTTTIGKLAQRFTTENRRVMLAAGDTFRAAAIEQLEIWAKRTGAAFAAQQPGADPGAVVFDAVKSAAARGIDVLIADTAGRLHSQSQLMDELRKVRRVAQRALEGAPHEVLLVLDANQGQNAIAQAEQFHAALGVTGLVLTKLDGTARGGAVVAIARRLGLPIRFIGVGESSDDFAEFDAATFAAALIDGGGEQSTA